MMAFRIRSREIVILAAAVLAGAWFITGGRARPVGTEIASCSAKAGEEECFARALAAVAASDGPVAAVRLLRESKQTIPALAYHCHRIAHEIGTAAARELGIGKALALGGGEPFCQYGYAHGATEEYLRQHYRPDALGEVVAASCGAITNDPDGGLVRNCFHGFGHGLMRAEGYQVAVAAGQCDRGTSDVRLQRMCHTGVFMELADAYDPHGAAAEPLSAAFTVTFQREEPFAVCDDFGDHYAFGCHFGILKHFFTEQVRPDRPDEMVRAGGAALAMCGGAGQPERCSFAAGVLLGNMGGWQRTSPLSEACRQAAAPALTRSCIQGMATRFAWVDRGQADRFCAGVGSNLVIPCREVLEIVSP